MIGQTSDNLSCLVLQYGTFALGNFRNLTKFNAYVFVKYLDISHSSDKNNRISIDRIQTAYISCCQIGYTLWLALPSNT